MPQEVPLEDPYYVNVVNGSTGAYLDEPLTPQEVGEAARTLVEKQQDEERVLMRKAFPTTQPAHRAVLGVDPRYGERRGLPDTGGREHA